MIESPVPPSPAVVRGAVVLTRLADIAPREIEYLWWSRIAKGRLTIIGGDPGLGKSFACLDVSARVTTGGPWPDGGVAPIGDVIILSAEDHAADTIRPRADALGADVGRVHILSAVRPPRAIGTETERMFSLVSDLALLEDAIAQTRAVLVTIDPLSAYLGMLDSYKDAHVRAVLGPLAALAERLNVTIVGVMHVSKGTDRRALARMLGSIAFVAAARVVLAVALDPDDDERRILVPVKSNICAPAQALAFRLTDGRLTWDADPVLGVNADQLLGASYLDREQGREADAWLRVALADGPTRSTEVLAAAEQAGLSRRTMFRAKARLKVEADRIGGRSGTWYWALPADAPAPISKSATAQRVPVAPFENPQQNRPDPSKGATAHEVALFDDPSVHEAPVEPSFDAADELAEERMAIQAEGRAHGR